MKLHATLAATAFVVAAGAISPAQAASIDGKAVYAELCASCHKTPQRLVQRMDLSPAGVKKLDEFLVGHYAKDDAKRKAVIEFMASLKK
jgi:cytochrome c553